MDDINKYIDENNEPKNFCSIYIKTISLTAQNIWWFPHSLFAKQFFHCLFIMFYILTSIYLQQLLHWRIFIIQNTQYFCCVYAGERYPPLTYSVTRIWASNSYFHITYKMSTDDHKILHIRGKEWIYKNKKKLLRAA